MLSVDVVPFLYVVFTQFRDSNKELSLLALKILANVALNSPPYAVMIFTTGLAFAKQIFYSEPYSRKYLRLEWLPLLSSMVTRGKCLEERLLSHKVCDIL